MPIWRDEFAARVGKEYADVESQMYCSSTTVMDAREIRTILMCGCGITTEGLVSFTNSGSSRPTGKASQRLLPSLAARMSVFRRASQSTPSGVRERWSAKGQLAISRSLCVGVELPSAQLNRRI